MKKWLFLLLAFFLFIPSLTTTHAIPLSQKGKAAQTAFKKGNYNYKKHYATYLPFGDYLNSSKKTFQMSRLKKDKQGIPMVLYSNGYQYNPVTVAQMALSYHGKYITGKGEDNKREFLKFSDALIRMQSKDGSFRYNFAYSKSYLHTSYKPGWVSGMAQGQAMSVFARAYKLTGDTKYLIAGQKAFKFMNTPISRGGTLTNLRDLGKKYKGKDYFYYEEYITKPNNYTLNGFMFSLLGLYDWSLISTSKDYGQKEAARMFALCIKTLEVVLPMYDIGGFTSYDLSGKTMKQSPHVVEMYYGIHLYQLYALHSITDNKKIAYYFKTWESYVR